MNLVPFLVLPLAAGYVFMSTWHASRYRTARESGHRLYFLVVYFAAFLYLPAAYVHFQLFDSGISWYQEILNFINQTLNIKETTITLWGTPSVVTITCLTLPLGPIFGYGLNFDSIARFLRVPKDDRYAFYLWEDFLLRRAIQYNDFEKLVHRSVTKSFPILFTLNTGKVYVGTALESPNPSINRKSIRILPWMSGYRDTETQEVVFTSDYLFVINNELLPHLTPEDFEVVIPTDQICASHLFDIETYSQRFNTD